MYLAGLRLTHQRATASIAVFVLMLSGGLGFVYFVADLDQHGPGVLQHLPRLYTRITPLGYQWLNPVLGMLLPQRSILFGLALVLVVVTLLWMAMSRSRETPRPWAPYAFAGVLTGITPLFHLHGYGTALALGAIWAAATRRRDWLWFLVPAVVIGLPAVLWMSPAHGFPARLQLGWLSAAGAGSQSPAGGHPENPAWFWLKNTSLLIPLMVVGAAWHGLIPPRLQRFIAPIWLWFLVPNVVVLQVWDWDNTKFFIYWLLFGAMLVGAVIRRLFISGPRGALVAVGCMVLLGLAGTLDLVRNLEASVSSATLVDARGQRLAAWVREDTPADAVFLVAPEHNHPVSMLGGRRIMVGYAGWLWSYGLYDEAMRRLADETLILHGDPRAPALLRQYRISYVVIGPSELAPPLSANVAWWRAHADLVYTDGEYSVYRVA
jgi:hypothetical protein